MSASSKAISVRPVNAPTARATADRFLDLTYTQEPGYALAAAARVGARCELFALETDASGADPVGYAAVRVKTIPVVGGGLAYLDGGPATHLRGEPLDPACWEMAVAALAAHYTQRRLPLRLRATGTADPGESETVLRRLGFVPARQPPGQTIVLDLTPSLDELRAALTGKWRTDLRRGEKANLRVVTSAEPADIARLQPLLSGLAARKGFGLNQDAEFFAAAAQGSPAGARVPFVAHLAFVGDELVAGHIGAFCGDTAVYLLGATGEQGRALRAAFVLQWAVIAYARASGMVRYDLGGIDAKANPDVYRLKARMGGAEVARPRWWEKRPAGILAVAIDAAEAIRNRVRGR